MRLIAVHDSDGIIVAAAVDDGTHRTPFPSPAVEGHGLVHIELGEELASLSAFELATGYRVDQVERCLIALESAD
jgi:hypothetical protein